MSETVRFLGPNYLRNEGRAFHLDPIGEAMSAADTAAIVALIEKAASLINGRWSRKTEARAEQRKMARLFKERCLAGFDA